MVIKVPELEPRLQARYRRLVKQHLSAAQGVAALGARIRVES